MALITYLTKIQFDFGALALVPEELAVLGIARPLVAADKGIVACGLLARLPRPRPIQKSPRTSSVVSPATLPSVS